MNGWLKLATSNEIPNKPKCKIQEHGHPNERDKTERVKKYVKGWTVRILYQSAS